MRAATGILPLNLENLPIIVFKLFIFNSTGESPMIPEEHTPAVVAYVCMVHTSVGDYSKLFLQKLRRCNFVTPKNYLDFINTYSNLLEENDQFILGERMDHKINEVSLRETDVMQSAVQSVV